MSEWGDAIRVMSAKDVRDAIADFADAISALIINAGNENAEIVISRGVFKNLWVRLDNSDSVLNSKISLQDAKNLLGFADINKNLSKIDQTMLTDVLLQQIAGTAPVNTTPADGGVTTPKYADNSVTEAKLDSNVRGTLDNLTSNVFPVGFGPLTKTDYGATYTLDGSNNLTVSGKTSVNARTQFSNINQITFTATANTKWLVIAYNSADAIKSLAVNLIGLTTRNVVYTEQENLTVTTIDSSQSATAAVAGDVIKVTIGTDRFTFLKNGAAWFEVLFSVLNAYSAYTHILGFLSTGTIANGTTIAQALAYLSTNGQLLVDRVKSLEHNTGDSAAQIDSINASIDTIKANVLPSATGSVTKTDYGATYTLDGSNNLTIASITASNFARTQFAGTNELTFTATANSKWVVLAYEPTDTTKALVVNILGYTTRDVVLTQSNSATTTIVVSKTGAQLVTGDIIKVTIGTDRFTFLKNGAAWFEVLFSEISAYSSYTHVLGLLNNSVTASGSVVAQSISYESTTTPTPLIDRVSNLESDVALIQTPTPTSTYQGKDIVGFGDSIMADVNNTGRGYLVQLKEKLGLNSVTNRAISGRPIANGTANGVGTNTTVRSEASFANYHGVWIEGMTNDFRLNVPLGTLGQLGDTTFDTNTFYGAYRDLIEYMLTQKYSLKIIIWTALQRDNVYAPNPEHWDTNYVNAVGLKLIDYVNASKEIGGLYSIPVIDLYHNSGITKLNLPYYTVDGLHLNTPGYDKVCPYLAGQTNAIGI